MASPKRFLILAKKEVTQFTDPVPVAGTDDILVKNLKVTPLKTDNEDRAIQRAWLGASEQLVVGEEAQIEFDCELANSASGLGVAPRFSILLRMCGLAETVTGGTKVEYSPTSSGWEYGTIYCYRDGLLYKFLGCAGNVVFDLAAKKIPTMKFRFIGKYAAVTDAALGTPTYANWKVPEASIPAKMGTVTVGAYAAKLAAANIDFGNEVSHAIWMNQETLAITDRKMKGSLTVELVTVATKDYWTDIRNATLAALTITQGLTAQNICTITAPKVQIMDVEETEYTNTLALKLGLMFAPNAGNDEFKLALT